MKHGYGRAASSETRLPIWPAWMDRCLCAVNGTVRLGRLQSPFARQEEENQRSGTDDQLMALTSPGSPRCRTQSFGLDVFRVHGSLLKPPFSQASRIIRSWNQTAPQTQVAVLLEWRPDGRGMGGQGNYQSMSCIPARIPTSEDCFSRSGGEVLAILTIASNATCLTP